MKRIKAACLFQTIHFTLKDDVPHDAAVRGVHDELAHFKSMLDRNRTKYRIIDESEQPDGSIIVRLKRQYNSYSCGEYMN